MGKARIVRRKEKRWDLGGGVWRGRMGKWCLVWFLMVLVLGYWCEAYPIEDLVVRLPGQPRVGFKQYAGYVDVDVHHGRSLFYYFVQAQTDPNHKPLTLWLNGGSLLINHSTLYPFLFIYYFISLSFSHLSLVFTGPGCSSIGGGAFTELGPFYPRGDGRGLRRNSQSWNRGMHFIYVYVYLFINFGGH